MTLESLGESLIHPCWPNAKIKRSGGRVMCRMEWRLRDDAASDSERVKGGWPKDCPTLFPQAAREAPFVHQVLER